MDITTITQVVSSVGFPIFCCIYLVKTYDKTINDLKKSVDNNTIAMQKILTKLGMFNDNDEGV